MPKTDMGQDGQDFLTNPDRLVGRDAFSESIGYYGDEDYKAIDASRWGGSGERPFAEVGSSGTLAAVYNPLYNGNIAHTVNSLQPFGGWNSTLQQGQVLAQVYRYDQLNRLKTAQGVEGLTMAANSWDGVHDAVTTRFRSEYTYDENGNIGTTKRWDEAGTQYDALNYHYETSGTELLRNRLYHLNETLDGGYGDIGVDGSAFEPAHNLINTNAYNNYNYDELGNLVKDEREGIAGIEWTVAGKVKHITRSSGSTQPELWFNYGADGQRTSKTVGVPSAGGYREYYIRDAQGNIMATYPYTNNGSASMKVTDRPMYGSKRLGSYTRPMELVGEEYPGTFVNYVQPMNTRLLHYELNDHLGNVTAVVTGRLLDGASAGSPKQAELLSAQGYEAFGSLMPGRNYSSDSYSYGFQGQIKDDEIYGATGTSYAFEYRMHDARVGRFLSLDPLAASYPHNSPYAFSENRVIDGVDLEGLEWSRIPNSTANGAQFTVKLKVINSSKAADENVMSMLSKMGPEVNAALSISTDKYNYNTTVQFELVSDITPASDFYIEMIDAPPGETVKLGSTSLGKSQVNRVALVGSVGGEDVTHNETWGPYLTRALAHELGHTAGLDHPDGAAATELVRKTYKAGIMDDNLMIQDIKLKEGHNQTDARDVSVDQFETMDKTVKEQQPDK